MLSDSCSKSQVNFTLDIANNSNFFLLSSRHFIRNFFSHSNSLKKLINSMIICPVFILKKSRILMLHHFKSCLILLAMSVGA